MAQETSTPDAGTGLTTETAAAQFAELAKAERKIAKKPESEPENAHIEGEDVPDEEGLEEEIEEAEPEPEAEEAEAEPEAEAEDEQEEETKADEVSDDALIPIKIDGKVEKVSIKEAKLGYQRQKKFTQRMQEVAEKERTLDGERGALRQLLESTQQTLEANIKAEGKTPEEMEVLRLTDPIEWSYQSTLETQREKQAAKVAKEIADLRAKEDEATLTKRKARRAEENTKLLEKIPEWSDDKKRDKDELEILKYAKSVGFSDAELTGLDRHEFLVVLRDGMRYRTLMAKKIVPDPKPAGKRVLKPGSAEGTRVATAETNRTVMNRLKASGSIDDAASAFSLLATRERKTRK